jgi:hypothetical protein
MTPVGGKGNFSAREWEWKEGKDADEDRCAWRYYDECRGSMSEGELREDGTDELEELAVVQLPCPRHSQPVQLLKPVDQRSPRDDAAGTVPNLHKLLH